MRALSCFAGGVAVGFGVVLLLALLRPAAAQPPYRCEVGGVIRYSAGPCPQLGAPAPATGPEMPDRPAARPAPEEPPPRRRPAPAEGPQSSDSRRAAAGGQP